MITHYTLILLVGFVHWCGAANTTLEVKYVTSFTLSNFEKFRKFTKIRKLFAIFFSYLNVLK